MNNIATLMLQPQFFIPFMIWSLFWKGMALWKSAGKRQLLWFVLLLIINTSGLLEIAYIYFLNRWDIDNGKTLKFLEKKSKQSKK
jgi:methionyl-tRNA synthetase